MREFQACDPADRPTGVSNHDLGIVEYRDMPDEWTMKRFTLWRSKGVYEPAPWTHNDD